MTSTYERGSETHLEFVTGALLLPHIWRDLFGLRVPTDCECANANPES
jgi:hypothetical protein